MLICHLKVNQRYKIANIIGIDWESTAKAMGYQGEVLSRCRASATIIDKAGMLVDRLSNNAIPLNTLLAAVPPAKADTIKILLGLMPALPVAAPQQTTVSYAIPPNLEKMSRLSESQRLHIANIIANSWKEIAQKLDVFNNVQNNFRGGESHQESAWVLLEHLHNFAFTLERFLNVLTPKQVTEVCERLGIKLPTPQPANDTPPPTKTVDYDTCPIPQGKDEQRILVKLIGNNDESIVTALSQKHPAFRVNFSITQDEAQQAQALLRQLHASKIPLDDLLVALHETNPDPLAAFAECLTGKWHLFEQCPSYDTVFSAPTSTMANGRS